MNWYHEVNPNWLEARKQVITATELVSLIPEYRRWRKDKSQLSAACKSLYFKKHGTDTPDVRSYKDAARGHIMEPYALDEYDNTYSPKHYLYHWDDAIITNNGIGWSPDAADVEQPADNGVCYAYGLLDDKPKHIGEIKCYGLENHGKWFNVDKMELKERLQLAVAMMVCPSIEDAVLIFYNPNSHWPVYRYTYRRDELKHDIYLLQEVYKMWSATKSYLDSMADDKPKALYTEEDIYLANVDDEAWTEEAE